MKTYALVGLVVAIQTFFPTSAFSDSQDDSKWASQRDPLADFCAGMQKSLYGVAKMVTGSSKAPETEAEAWGTRRGGWDIAPPDPAGATAGITIIESSKKVLESKNVQIQSADGSRMIRRFGPNDKSVTAPLKKMIDSGSSSYALGSYGAPGRYYPIGTGPAATAGGYRGVGGVRTGGGWGSLSEGSSLYGTYSYGFGRASTSGAAGQGGGFGSRSLSASGGASRAF
jgi:hypothetical protein